MRDWLAGASTRDAFRRRLLLDFGMLFSRTILLGMRASTQTGTLCVLKYVGSANALGPVGFPRCQYFGSDPDLLVELDHVSVVHADATT